jgi:hypothetical protein
MGTKKKAKADTALPTIAGPLHTDVTRVSATRTTATAMEASPLWAGAPQLQTATTGWTKAADALEANGKVIADFRKKLAAAIADQHGLRRDWKAATGQVVASAAIVCQGSVDQVRALGFEVRSHGPIGALPAPTGLTASPGKGLGEVVFAWKRGSARHGFIVQHATDVANQATYSGMLPCTRSKYTLNGAQASSTVHFRVAAVDPSSDTDLGPWSDWIAGQVR